MTLRTFTFNACSNCISRVKNTRHDVSMSFISRIIFSFNYRKGLKWKIGIFGGVASTALIYFMLIKGIKDLSFMTPELKGWITIIRPAPIRKYMGVLAGRFSDPIMNVFGSPAPLAT